MKTFAEWPRYVKNKKVVFIVTEWLDFILSTSLVNKAGNDTNL